MRSTALARLAGVSPDTLRHYEAKGLLPRAARSKNGYREYPAEALARVGLVRRAVALGFTLDELARINVRGKGFGGKHHSTVISMGACPNATPACATSDGPHCPITTSRLASRSLLLMSIVPGDWMIRSPSRRSTSRRYFPGGTLIENPPATFVVAE